jgi:hypothetical protein
VKCRVLLIGCCIVAAAGGGGSAPAQCTGDCEGNAQVNIVDLTRGVDMLLDATLRDSCRALFRRNGEPAITIADLVLAVNNALNGCPGCRPLDEPYPAPCVMPKGAAECFAPGPAVTLAQWRVDSNGTTVRIEQDGIDPPLVYLAVVRRTAIADTTVADIESVSTGAGIVHAASGTVSLTQERDNSVLTVNPVAPPLTISGACHVKKLLGTF